MKKVILASTSPYRKELLERLSINFDCISPLVDEEDIKISNLTSREIAEELALRKATAVASSHLNAVVIGGDQVLDFDGEILGKPGSVDNAVEQLLKLSGKEHKLITSIAVVCGSKQIIYTDTTTLKMRHLNKEQIEKYVRRDMPLWCAGSYMLEKQGIALFESIESKDQTAIIGIPMIELVNILEQFEINIF